LLKFDIAANWQRMERRCACLIRPGAPVVLAYPTWVMRLFFGVHACSATSQSIQAHFSAANARNING